MACNTRHRLSTFVEWCTQYWTFILPFNVSCFNESTPKYFNTNAEFVFIFYFAVMLNGHVAPAGLQL